MPKISKAVFLLLVALALAAPGCRKNQKRAGRAASPHVRQVVVLGFDGADPHLLAKWMSAGKLPHLARLAAQGAFRPLGTTNPPESPVSWASFATGLNPGNTGIFDFLTRDPKTYLPQLALVKSQKAKFLFSLVPVKAPVLVNERHGVPFYKTVAGAGYKTVVLRMPLEFPPTPMPGGKLWAGLGVPDVRATWGTFFYFSTDLEPWDAGNTEFGGKLVSLRLKGRTARAFIDGPIDPAAKTFRRISAPVEFTVQPVRNSVSISLGGRRESVQKGHWSGWFRVRFRITPLFAVHAITRFYVVEAFPNLRVYMSPLNIDPVSPALPISYPTSFTAALAKRQGLFKTLGWWDDTWALNDEKMSDGVFLDDALATMRKLGGITVGELKQDDPRLMISIFTGTDSVSHMFYRLMDRRSPSYDPVEAQKYGDAILRAYEQMDQIVGEVEQAMEPGATLLIVSDHGFHGFWRGFNTNTWLVKNGFMTLRDPSLQRKSYSLSDLFGKGSFFPNVDWSRTQAYSLGLGQIYLNLRGREGQGIVTPGPEAAHLLQQIRTKLLAYRDPQTRQPVLQAVYLGSQIDRGAYLRDAPDLQLAFQPGYRTSWQTSLGAIPPGIVILNHRKWSGDHCSSDPSNTQGIFLSSRRMTSADPSIVDIAPTVLRMFNVKSPQPLDGKPLQFVGENSARR
ncbi:MAG: alkaline phosphatase family protein [Terriglobia bacterium]